MSDTNFTPDSDNSFVDPEGVVDELDIDPMCRRTTMASPRSWTTKLSPSPRRLAA